MFRSHLNQFLASLLVFLLALLALTYQSPTRVLSATTHVVISEIQIEGELSNDEFVELYNPTDTPFDVTNWRLTRKTAAGNQSTLVNSLNGSIAPHGYLLIAHPDYDGLIPEDIAYSATSSGIAENNTVVLYSDEGITVVDTVGMGTASDVETAATSVPDDDGSIERKAQISSTLESMTTGVDSASGNGEDTDHNANDFIKRTVSDPQNSSSSIEILILPSPAPTPSPSIEPSTLPTPLPSIDPTPNPSASPVVSPQPSVSPTPTPEASPSATPEPTPTVTPNPSVIPSIDPSPAPTPSSSIEPSSLPSPLPSIDPTPSPSASPDIIFQGFLFTCKRTYKEISFGSFKIKFPSIRCSRN